MMCCAAAARRQPLALRAAGILPERQCFQCFASVTCRVRKNQMLSMPIWWLLRQKEGRLAPRVRPQRELCCRRASPVHHII